MNLVTLVGNDTNWVAIGAGSNHCIALKANGSLWTWGSNTMGQLGDGTTTDIYLPTQVGTKTDWKQADGGDAFTMAVKTDGTLWGWGNNASGQLGDGTNVNKLTPTQIGTDHNWMYVSCGASFTVALKTNGTLWTWGDNASGQLCDGTVINRNTPRQIGIDLDWHKIAAGGNNFAAIKTDSTVWSPSSNSIAKYNNLSSWNKVHVSSTGWITPTNSSVGQVNLNLGGEYVNRAQRKCYPCNTTVTDLGKAVISSVNFNLAYSGVQPAPGIEKAPQQTCRTAIPAVAIVGAGEILLISSCSGGAYTFPKTTISSDLMWGNLANGTEHILFIQKVSVKSNPEISWPIPTDITYGTALSATQLNATANVSGTFVYTPALDSVLSVGKHDLIVEFTPTFTDFYNVVRDTVSITVTAKEPVITWSTPADITYGTALSTTQLNATADVPGAFVYDPAANTVLAVGDNQLLKCTFTPTDAVNYKSVSDTVYINVKKEPMQLKFTTNADNRTIKLPLYGTVNCTVDWGDGSATEDFTTTGRKRHTFATAGTYTVKISGSLTQFGYYNEEAEDGWDGAGYLTEVTDFGDMGLTSLSGAFCKANNLTSVPASLPATVTDLSYCFYVNSKATITNLNLWDVSHVTDMSNMFYYATAFNQDISAWDVSAVTNMENMFKRTDAFNQNISTWDVGSVTNMEDMFRSAVAFNQPIGTWDVSSVTTMEGMFESTNDFNQNISTWNVSKVNNMSWMFGGAIAFDQNLANWDISSVTSMDKMFYNTTLSTTNYDAMLIAWAAQTVKPNVLFGGGNSKYSAGTATTARNVLTGSPNNWTITDGGLAVTTDLTNSTITSQNISPNPVLNDFVIDGLKTNAEIMIMDITGKVQQQNHVTSSTTRIAANKLKAGIYVVIVTSNDKTWKLKLVKR